MFRIIAHIFRMYLRPQVLFALIAIWYKSPNPGRLFKDFISDNIHLTAFVFGIFTALAALYCYSTRDLSAAIYAVGESFLLLLTFPLLLVLFRRVHHKYSPRINWRKTLEPAKDLFIVWAITALFSCLVLLFVLLISKS